MIAQPPIEHTARDFYVCYEPREKPLRNPESKAMTLDFPSILAYLSDRHSARDFHCRWVWLKSSTSCIYIYIPMITLFGELCPTFFKPSPTGLERKSCKLLFGPIGIILQKPIITASIISCSVIVV